MTDSLETDQDQRSVGPDFGPNCLQRLSADDSLAGKELIMKFGTITSKDTAIK